MQEQPARSTPIPMPFQALAATPSEISYPTPDTKAPEAAPQPTKLIMPASKPQASTIHTPSPQSAASQRLYKIWEAVRDAPKPRRPTQSPASTASRQLPEPQATTSTSTSQQPSKRTPAGPSTSPPHKATSEEQRKELYGDWTNSTLRNNYSDDEDEDIIDTDSEHEYEEDDPEYDEEYTGESPDYDGEDPQMLW